MEETIFLTRASLPDFQEYIEEIKDIWETQWITSFGPKHSQLETVLQQFLHSSPVLLFANGHAALEMTLQAMELTGEVITTPYTFVSTTSSIVKNGLIPVFCDVNPDDCTIDPNKIESLITEKTCAILPVHIYGNFCDTDSIENIAKKHNLKVIYDAAHAFGTKRLGKSAAVFGDASIFSFHASKVFNTAEGGASCVQDENVRNKLSNIRFFGTNGDDVLYPAGNGKMSELSAALGLCNLRHFSENVERRKKLSELYEQTLSDREEISFMKKQKNVEYNYSYLPIFLPSSEARDKLFCYLQSKNILCQKQFGRITSSYSCFRNQYRGDTPIATSLSERVLLLPLYASMCEETVLSICKAIHSVMESKE